MSWLSPSAFSRGQYIRVGLTSVGIRLTGTTDEDQPTHGLKRGDLGTVVEVFAPDAVEVEFVTASGRTQASVTLPPSAVREVGDDDLVTVRPATSRDI